MGYRIHRSLRERVWDLVRRQHGVVARWQLLELGVHSQAIKRRIATGRLHPVHRGVYAVGRPDLTRLGHWMAAVLACGPRAVLSHSSAAALWRIRRAGPGRIQVSLPGAVVRRPKGIEGHRSRTLDGDTTTHLGIPVTTPTRTLIDLATVLTPNQLEAAVNEADSLGLIDPETLRRDLARRSGRPGVPALRALLDRHTYRMTETELERRFLRIVKGAGLPLPDTQVETAGRTDFHWDDLNLVVETDGWRYHRTPSRRARDNRRMQQHALAGRTAIRLSHYEIRFEERRVTGLMAALTASA